MLTYKQNFYFISNAFIHLHTDFFLHKKKEKERKKNPKKNYNLIY